MNEPLGKKLLKCHYIFVHSLHCAASLQTNYKGLTQRQREPKAERDSRVLSELKACCSTDYGDNVASGKGTYTSKWFCQRSFYYCYHASVKANTVITHWRQD